MLKQLKLLWLVLVLPLILPLTAQAAVQDKYKEGTDYRILSSQVRTTVKQDQIEVAEVFWYGCPHCYTLEPIVDRWKPSLAKKDARFVRIPGFFNPDIWKDHAQLYYTLETMIPGEKKLHTIHDSVFSAIQKDLDNCRDMKKRDDHCLYLKKPDGRDKRLALNVEAMGDFLKQSYGIDPKQFASFYNSFGVLNLMIQGGAKIKGYQLTGVPVLVVDGRYVIEPKVGLENMTAVADFLIDKVREEREAKTQSQVKEASETKS